MKRSTRLAPFIVLIMLIAGSFVAWSQRYNIYDWSRLRGYQPPAAIAQLATDTTMNDDTRRVFYAHHPELDDRSTFRTHCSNFDEVTIVLGCYVPKTGIYVFDIDDPRLSGVEEVTAAHELLHVAYERLGSKERAHIDKLTQQALASVKDERIKSTVESYRTRDPSVVPNELHSIIGTEVSELPAELENYYKRYFDSRAQIVTFAEKYEGAITERRDRAEAIRLELEGLKQEIEQQQETLATEREQLQNDRSKANTQAEVDAFNARVNAYNANIREFNSMISHYNTLVDEYQTVSLEAQELYKALDSRPTL